jgi:hypothetical protein
MSLQCHGANYYPTGYVGTPRRSNTIIRLRFAVAGRGHETVYCRSTALVNGLKHGLDDLDNGVNNNSHCKMRKTSGLLGGMDIVRMHGASYAFVFAPLASGPPSASLGCSSSAMNRRSVAACSHEPGGGGGPDRAQNSALSLGVRAVPVKRALLARNTIVHYNSCSVRRDIIIIIVTHGCAGIQWANQHVTCYTSDMSSQGTPLSLLIY